VEMFGDPNVNPRKWPVSKLDSVVQFFAGNSLPVGVPYEAQSDGYFLMKVSDMNLVENEQFIVRCQMWAADRGARSATCPAGSVVIPKRGGAIGTNKKRITMRPTVLDPNLMAIAPVSSSIHLTYLFQWFLRFDLASISSGSSVPQLNKQDLAPLKVQIPPIEIQNAFADRISAIEDLKAIGRAALAESDALFASLQHRAFTGQLA
jgi:type I restriction enzyme, S subunit